MKPKFLVKAISNNTDIMKWIKYLRIPHFKGVFSRNTLPGILKEGESMVINVDHSSSGGTHLVTCYVSKQIEYMDTFGLEPPIEFFSYFVRSKKLGVYNSTQYQNIYSVLCGSFCLYYINERDRGRSAYNTLYAPSNNTLSNENFLGTYFENI